MGGRGSSGVRNTGSFTPLYHGTTFKSMFEILKSNELRGNVSNETETYGVSTTRNKETAYDTVSLVLDKELLRTRYKIHPVYRESIFGRDLAEERIDRTITNLSKYVKELRWNDSSKSNIYLKRLRRELVENFDNPKFTNSPTRTTSSGITISNDAYYLKQLAREAKKRGIPLDKRMKEAVSYIRKFDRREFDTERYQQMQERKSRRKK